MTDVYGWHFTNAGGTLGYGDGRKVVVGETLTVNVKPVLCLAGLHASVNAIDALRNAQSRGMAWRVRLSGKIAKPTREHPDKYAATERTAIAGVEFAPIAQMFVRDTLAYRQPHLVTLFERAKMPDRAEAIKALDMYGDIAVVHKVLRSAYAAAYAATTNAYATNAYAAYAAYATNATNAATAAAAADADAATTATAAYAAYTDAADAATTNAYAAYADAYATNAYAAHVARAADDAAMVDLNAMLEKRLYAAMGITSRRKTVKR